MTQNNFDLNMTALSGEAMNADPDMWDPLNDQDHAEKMLIAFPGIELDLEGDVEQMSGVLTLVGGETFKAAILRTDDFFASYRRLITLLVALTRM